MTLYTHALCPVFSEHDSYTCTCILNRNAAIPVTCFNTLACLQCCIQIDHKYLRCFLDWALTYTCFQWSDILKMFWETGPLHLPVSNGVSNYKILFKKTSLPVLQCCIQIYHTHLRCFEKMGPDILLFQRLPWRSGYGVGLREVNGSVSSVFQ